MTLTPDQLHILQHSLGCDEYGHSESRGRDENDGCFGHFRNRYVSDPTDDLTTLVAAGLMTDFGPQGICGDMHYYRVTQAGLTVMLAQSPKPPKLTRGQQRYRDFLREDSSLSFGEWLKLRHAYDTRDTLATSTLP